MSEIILFWFLIKSWFLKLPVNKIKQRSAFPPNFIHSLDSTHVMYTVVECRKELQIFLLKHKIKFC